MCSYLVGEGWQATRWMIVALGRSTTKCLNVLIYSHSHYVGLGILEGTSQVLWRELTVNFLFTALG